MSLAPLPALIAKLTAIRAHELPTSPDDIDFENHADHLRQVASAMAEWVEDEAKRLNPHLQGKEVIAERNARENAYDIILDEIQFGCVEAATRLREEAPRRRATHPDCVWNHRQTGVGAGYRGL